MARCRDAMNDAKQQFDVLPAAEIIDLYRFTSPALATAASRCLAAPPVRPRRPAREPCHLQRPRPPPTALLRRGEIAHQFPLNIIIDGQGLNITVMSYLDRLDFGFVADRDLIPDLEDFADMHIDEITRLFNATGAEWAHPPEPPSRHRDPTGPTTKAEPAVIDATTREPARKKTAVKKPAAHKPRPRKRAATRPTASA